MNLITQLPGYSRCLVGNRLFWLCMFISAHTLKFMLHTVVELFLPLIARFFYIQSQKLISVSGNCTFQDVYIISFASQSPVQLSSFSPLLCYFALYTS